MLRMEVQLQPEKAVAIMSGEPVEQGQPLRVMRAKVAEGNNVRDVPIFPGSSLKGVVRSHCERIARSLGLWCCNPFDVEISANQAQRQRDLANREKFCGKKIEERIEQGEELQGAMLYQSHSCRICRLFGSTGMGSHFFLSDALPRQGSSFSIRPRPHIAIDRVLGSVAGSALWYEEVVETGRFIAILELRNFELWQLGLVALALRDLGEGRIRIGHSKSRGYGRVNLEVRSAELGYYGFSFVSGTPPLLEGVASKKQWALQVEGGPWRLYGVGPLLSDEDWSAYGYHDNDYVDVQLETNFALQPEREWPLVRILFADYQKQLLPFLEQCVTQKLSAAVREDGGS
jgi:CRISPR-associated RAMP protein (TIGR02581 family)